MRLSKTIDSIYFFSVFCYRLRATHTNIYRSGLSASLVKDLPNVREYIYTDRHRLIEEKRIHCQMDRLLSGSNNNAHDQTLESTSGLSDYPAD